MKEDTFNHLCRTNVQIESAPTCLAFPFAEIYLSYQMGQKYHPKQLKVKEGAIIATWNLQRSETN